MIVILKDHPEQSQLDSLIHWLRSQNIQVHPTVGENQTILGLVGDTSSLDMDLIAALDIVDDVKRVQEPYKNVNRKFHPDDTVIRVGDTQIGGGNLTLIAGPCVVENEEQILGIARAVKAGGATMLRGCAFNSASSPYAFQGLKIEGVRLLMKAKEETGLPVVCEIMDASQLPLFADIDVLMVGARNMQNYALLRALGRTDKPILLKRGRSATYEDLLMSAEYILAEGNSRVILCERGIRTFEDYTRDTIDITAVPALKTHSHLPVIVDPGIGSGRAALVPPLAQAAVAAGADGVMVEVHTDPGHAWVGGLSSITPDAFTALAERLKKMKTLLAQG